MTINWDDPAERLALIERVGADEYNRLAQEHFRKTTVATEAGHNIRIVNTRFGQLFMVEGTDKAFSTLEEAKAFIKAQVEGGAS